MQSRPGRAVSRAPLAHLDRQELLAVFAGGFLGAVLRGALAESVTQGPGDWPWPTFAANIAGAIAARLRRSRASPSGSRRTLLPPLVPRQRAVRGADDVLRR